MRCVLTRYASLPLLGIFLLLQGCGGDPTPPPPPKASPVTPPAQQQVASLPPPVQEQEQKEKLLPEDYSYDPGDRPDPFKSILLTGSAKNQHLLPPLQQREVTELRVIAIVWGGLGQSAMLQTPDGKGYTVRVGTRVGPNQGVVRKINPQSVIVEERYTDVFGETKRREVILELRPSGEKNE